MRQFVATRQVLDQAARYVVSAGGIAVILAILAIFFFIFREVTPLFASPQGRLLHKADLHIGPQTKQPLHLGLDESRSIAYLISSGSVRFFELPSGATIPITQPDELSEHRVTSIAQGGVGSQRYMLGTGDGLVLPLKAGVTSAFSDEGERQRRPLLKAAHPFRLATEGIASLAYRTGGAGAAVAAVTDQGRLLFASVPEGDADEASTVRELHRFEEPVSQVILDAALENVYAGTAGGELYHFTLEGTGAAAAPAVYRIGKETPISLIGFLNGDRTLVVATGDGRVSAWGLMRVPGLHGRFRLEPMHRFDAHRTPVSAFSASTRDKGFVTADETGRVFVHYSTSEQTLLKLDVTNQALRAVALSPKADGLAALDAAGQLTLYELRNPFPEITWQTLFGSVWYEGYDRPEHVWQSSSGSDEFEPKYGLMPLAFGTIKGTIYALFLAVPLAILSAAFTSQFMHPDIRGTIKPIIEVMAALPTVVLGFLAGLWLAPLLERYFPSLVGMVITIPLVVVVCSLLWHVVPATIRKLIRPGFEALLLMPVIAGTALLCVWMNQGLETVLFGGDFKQWVVDTFGVHYDQRNAVVVGIVMGFAIIPIIYSIAEEAMSNVPRHLIAGSLALGATRWQTVLRLVLLAASPGIFSAMMIGFGRAIGETMIVLMATGNTPILDMSWTNGFRTLSANIAVEIPEAPHGGTLYRVLFLAALLLFVVTFVINTAAELVRQRLRTKYTSG